MIINVDMLIWLYWMRNKIQTKKNETKLTQKCHDSNNDYDNKISISNNQESSISSNITECSLEERRANTSCIHRHGWPLTGATIQTLVCPKAISIANAVCWSSTVMTGRTSKFLCTKQNKECLTIKIKIQSENETN